MPPRKQNTSTYTHICTFSCPILALSISTDSTPLSRCSSNFIGPDGATAMAAPLAFLTCLKELNLMCVLTSPLSSGSGGGRDKF